MKITKIFIAGLIMSMMQACALFQSTAAGPIITAAVDIAVATAESKGVAATDINRVAKLALAADSGTSATLAAIMQLVNAQIAKLNLPPGDQAGIVILETALSAAIQAKIGGSTNLANAQAAVADVLNAVIAASGG